MRYDIDIFSSRKVFFASDTHFWHSRIMESCCRPVGSVEEMNETLISNWNRVVPKDGIVFHLGDFSFGGEREWNDILDRLKGRIYLILGNHDMQMARKSVMDRFEEVCLEKIIMVDDRRIILNHNPLLCYSGAERGEWQLFGHVHSGELSVNGVDLPRLVNLYRTQYDVGVDNNDFTPVSYGQIKEILDSH